MKGSASKVCRNQSAVLAECDRQQPGEPVAATGAAAVDGEVVIAKCDPFDHSLELKHLVSNSVDLL